jgi:hypothetical protein
MPIKSTVVIVGGTGGPDNNAVPVYRDGVQRDWALDRLGNQLLLPNGVECWYYLPETLGADIAKYYVTYKPDGGYSYIQVFEPSGDLPVLSGLPKQEYWIEYSHLMRVTAAPPPVVVPPAPAPSGVSEADLEAVGRVLAEILRKLLA